MVPLAFGLGAAGIAGTTGAIGLKQFLAKKKKKRSAGNALGSLWVCVEKTERSRHRQIRTGSLPFVILKQGSNCGQR